MVLLQVHCQRGFKALYIFPLFFEIQPVIEQSCDVLIKSWNMPTATTTKILKKLTIQDGHNNNNNNNTKNNTTIRYGYPPAKLKKWICALKNLEDNNKIHDILTYIHVHVSRFMCAPVGTNKQINKNHLNINTPHTPLQVCTVIYIDTPGCFAFNFQNTISEHIY